MFKRFIVFVAMLVVPSLFFAGCSSTQKQTAGASRAPEWIQESNKIAESYSRDRAAIVPETGSGLGYRQYDALATRLDQELETRYEVLLQNWKTKLEGLKGTTLNPEVLIDIRVLIDDVEGALLWNKLEDKYGVIPFEQLTESVFYSLADLLNEQSPVERKQAAVERFKKYVRGFQDGDKKARPRAEAARSNTEAKIKTYAAKSGPSGGRIYYPLRAEVDNYLKNSPDILKGIEGLLAKSGREDWKEDFKAFSTQVQTYDNWVRTTVRPLSRTDYKIPMEMYEHSLRQYGHRDSPEDVRKRARDEFTKLSKEYAEIASAIAKRDGLKEATPKAVLKHLKKTIETDPEKIRQRYVQADADLSADIKRRDLVTLPEIPLKVRVASEAESRIQPVPHLDSPPLIGNSGERPEFVVPVGSKDKLAFDDFAFPAAAKSLTAHEGRPGHDLQFSSILDRGVSVIRARYAFNSVNVEGWALYAEWLMEPSLSVDEKMGLYMARMMRNARMFLDPEIHLGKLTPEEAKRVITEQVGMSPEWAALELQRYMYRSPAQAPSYFYGYLKLRAIREETMKRMGSGFRERCFHDAILDAGLLPLEILAEKMRTLKCEI